MGRLILTALILPPRVIRSVSRMERNDLEKVRLSIAEEATILSEDPYPEIGIAERHGWLAGKFATIARVGGSFMIIAAIGLCWLMLYNIGSRFIQSQIAVYLVTFGIIVAPFLIGWLGIRAWAYSVSLSIHAAKAILRALSEEVAALERGDPSRTESIQTKTGAA
ncbi:MAG: hypothetical protein L0287_22870, partial [Anaerolineae bacterium]|nr:hypothetical protein [Anaerolineae bacterium]